MNTISVTIALVIVALAAFYYLSTRNFNHWKDKGIPFIKPFPLVGSQWSVVSLKEPMGEFFNRVARKYKGQKFVGFFQGNTPSLLVLDSELAKTILIKDFSSFVNHGFEISEEADPLLSKNLFHMRGQKWKEMRNKLSPTFTSGKMKGMYPLVEDCAKNFENYMRQHQNENIDLKDIMARFTTDVIASCVFGLSIDSMADPKNHFREMGRKFLDVDFIQGIKNAFIVFLPKIAHLFKFQFLSEELSTTFRGLVNEIVSQRLKTGNTRKDFMQLLIQLRQLGKLKRDEDEKSEHDEGFTVEQTENNLTDDDVVAQAAVFFFAGFDTSSSIMTFILMELARYPDVQQKARDQIEEILQRHDGKMGYQALQEMTYLENILQEALRMYPPLPMLNRVCVKNYLIPGTNLHLEKGTLLVIPHQALQNDSDHFEDPATFNPDRFEDEELLKNKFVYMPFGEGPRQCIGMRFAKMQVKLGLYSILRNFDVLTSPKTVYPPVWNPKQLLLSAKDEIFIQMKAL